MTELKVNTSSILLEEARRLNLAVLNLRWETAVGVIERMDPELWEVDEALLGPNLSEEAREFLKDVRQIIVEHQQELYYKHCQGEEEDEDTSM